MGCSSLPSAADPRIGPVRRLHLRALQQVPHDLADLRTSCCATRWLKEIEARIARAVSSFSARDPQFEVTIDREKAKSLGVPFSQITSTLQVYMGSQYVNDFDFNNRSYRVYVQADQSSGTQPRDLRQFYVRSDTGRWCQLDKLVKIKETTNAAIISHYNLFRSAEINGSARRDTVRARLAGDGATGEETLPEAIRSSGQAYLWKRSSLVGSH